MSDHNFLRRHFFYGTLLAGALPRGGFGSTISLKAAGYKSPNEKLTACSHFAIASKYTERLVLGFAAVHVEGKLSGTTPTANSRMARKPMGG